jgi:hypothetical protein
MKWLNGSKIRIMLIGLVMVLLVVVALAQPAENDNTEIAIMIAGHEHRYQPRPDLGYVILAKDNSDAMTSVKFRTF